MIRLRGIVPFFLLGCCAFAQTNTGVIRGIVSDPTGSVIAGASVTAVNTATGVKYSASASDAGLYSIPGVPAGGYTVTVEHPGFRRYVRTGVTVTTGETVALEVKLELGNVSQSVNVTGEAPQVEASTSGIDQLIDSKSVTDLPLADRRTMNIINMTGAAVFTGYDRGQKPNFILAGGRAQSQMMWIDGGSGQNMRLGIGQMNTDPPVELVSEIKVLSNAFSAEYGASAGGVILETTKSGTNEFHGSAYEYLRNDALDAPGFFAPVQNGSKVVPELRYNVFGGSVGGPIRHNKTFFFFDYEGQRRETGGVDTLTVPSLLQRAGDFSQTFNAKGQVIPIYDPGTTQLANGQYVRQLYPGNIIPSSQLDPVARKLMAFYPLPNRPPDTLAGANNFRSNIVNGLVHDFYSIKVDHTLTDRDRLTGRFMYNRDNSNHSSAYPDPAADPANFALAHQADFYGDWTRTISPTAVSDFRFHFNQRYWWNETGGLNGDYPQKLGLTGVPETAFPRFAPAGVAALGSTSQERLQAPIQDEQFVENFSTVHGKHALKFGVEARRARNLDLNMPTVSGQFNFSTMPTGLPGTAASGTGLASMMLGFATGFTELSTDPLDRSTWYLAGFAQDDWQVTPNFTLNLGLRWETDTPMIDANNRMNGFDPNAINPVSGTPGVVQFMGVDGYRTSPYDTNWTNFGPRVGFAWRVNGSQDLVVRGGFGIFYAHPFDAGVPNQAALGFSQQLNLNSPDNGITPALLLRNGVAGTATAPVLNSSFGAVPVGKATNTAVTFFEPNRDTGYSEQFNIGVQKQLPSSMVVEVTAMGNLSRHLPSAGLSMNQIAPWVLSPTQDTQMYRPFPQFTNVSIISPTLGVSNYYAGMVRLEKRFSHGLNLTASYTFSKFLENCNDPGTSAGDDPGYEDYYNRALDYGPSANDIPQRFTFASVYELPWGRGKHWLKSGILSSVLGGWAVGNITTVQSGAPFTVTTQTNNTYAFSAGAQRAQVLRNPNLPSGQQSVAQWFDTSAFVQPANFMFGNEGRNILRGPGHASLDFSLERNFQISERMKFQLRGEFFNALNHTNFGLPNHTLGAPAFGIISGAGPAREVQIGARLWF